MTTVEERFLAALKQFSDPGSIAFFKYFNEDRKALRKSLIETAYHEAGHVAAQGFTWLEPSHIFRVSIIPDSETKGMVSFFGAITLKLFELQEVPDTRKRVQGYHLLMYLLAGDMAKELVTKGSLTAFDIEEWLDENEENEGTDAYRANMVASVMSKPGWSPQRILAVAERWTAEMLRISEVWQYLETLASKLLEDGVIQGEQLDGFLHDENVLGLWLRLPKWKRRFLG